MPLVGSYQQGAFVTPVNGGPGDASVVLANDNATRLKYNAHDADGTIHVQSSVFASRPAAGTAGRFWITSDGLRAYYDSGSVWGELAYLSLAGGGTVAGLVTASAGLVVGGPKTLSAAEVSSFSFETPVSRFYVGDGTGYGFRLAKRVGSTTTDLVSFPDTGGITALVGPVTSRSGSTGSIANSSTAAIITSASLVAGAYLVTAYQTGAPAGRCQYLLYSDGLGTTTSSGLTALATAGGLTLITVNSDVHVSNSTGGAATFGWAFVRLA